jgi:hypothetical protein
MALTTQEQARLSELQRRRQVAPESTQVQTPTNPPQTGVQGIAGQQVAEFDPEGSGFDLQTFKESGGVPDAIGHMGSLDPRTGMLLKGIRHPTFNLTVEEESRRGNKIVKKGNRFFSVPISDPRPAVRPQTGLSPAKQARLNELATRRQPQQGQIITSEPIPEPEASRILREWEQQKYTQEYQVAKAQRRKSTRRAMSIGDYSGIDPIGMLEILPELGLRDVKIKRQFVRQLEAQGVPKEAMAEYIRSVSPAGWKQFLKEEAFETTGEMVGMGLGYKFGGPRGGVLGAGAGRAAGSAAEDAYQSIFYPEREQTAGGIAKDIGWDFVEGAAGEYLGQKALGLIGLRQAPVKSLKPKAARLSDELIKAGKQLGPEDIPGQMGGKIPRGFFNQKLRSGLTVAQQTAHKLLDTLEEIAEGSFFGQQAMFRTKQILQPAAFAKWSDNVVDEFVEGTAKNLSPRSLRLLVSDHLSGAKSAWHSLSSQLYKNVDDMVGVDDIVDPKKAVKIVDDLIKKAKAGKALGVDENKLLAEAVANLKKMSFSDAHFVKSQLGELVQRFDDTGHGILSHKARSVRDALEEAMKKAARGQGDDVWRAYHRATRFNDAGRKRFGTKLIKKFTKNVADNPEGILHGLLDKHSDVVQIKKMLLGKAGKGAKQIAEDERVWKTLRHHYLKDLLVQNSTAGVVQGKKLREVINKKIGDRTMKLIFPGKGEVDRIKDIFELGIMIQEKTGGKGGMLIQLVQGGLGFGSILTGHPVIGGTILGGPAILARVVASPTGSRYLLRGLKELKTTGRISAGTSRIFLKEYFKIWKKYKQEQREYPAKKRREEAQERRKAFVRQKTRERKTTTPEEQFLTGGAKFRGF